MQVLQTVEGSLLKSGRKSLENLSIWKVLVKALFQRNYLKSVHFMKIYNFVCNDTKQ